MTELAAALGVNRTVVYRLVTTLERRSLVRRDGHGHLHVGLGILHLAAAVHPVLRDLALPVLRELAEEVGATAHLTVAEGDERWRWPVVEPSWTDFHVAYRVGRGTRSPAAPRARRSCSAAPTTRRRGLVTTGELQSGAWGLAAPVSRVEGLEASVGVICLEEIDEQHWGPRVVEAAARLAAGLPSGSAAGFRDARSSTAGRGLRGQGQHPVGDLLLERDHGRGADDARVAEHAVDHPLEVGVGLPRPRAPTCRRRR